MPPDAALLVPDLLAIEELAVGDGGIALGVLFGNAALVTLAREEVALIPEGARGWVAALSAAR